MATSGTPFITYTVDDIVKEAFELADGFGVTLNATSAKSAVRSLNLVLKDIVSQGVPLAKREITTLTVTQGVAEYTLDNGIVDILEMMTVVDGKDLGTIKVGLTDYLRISDKTIQSRPTQFAVKQDRLTPKLYLYPTPNAEVDTLKVEVLKQVDKVISLGEELDVNASYFLPVAFGLAYMLSLKSEVPSNKRAELKMRYDETLMNARVNDTDRHNLVLNLR